MKTFKKTKKRVTAAILIIGMAATVIPERKGYAATTSDSVYAAAYEDATALTETTLPTSVTIGGESTNVTWDLTAITNATAYDTVEVTGTAADTEVTAQVEVLPKKENPVVYFVDAGRDGVESKAFTSVAELASESLVNTIADQEKTEDTTWGRSGSNFVQKGVGSLDVTKKIQTGWYSSSKTASLTYEYELEPGTYTVTTGFYEWWNGRSMKVAFSGDGMTEVTSETATVSGVGDSDVISTTITVDSTCLVTMEVQNATGGEAPVISWFAVAKGELEKQADSIDIEVNGADVESAASNVNGLTWKGFGVLSGNSTSNLLMDYKTEAPDVYNEMLEVLFGGEHPLMNHVKIEMGNDGNNSTGADACTMRSENEEADASRSPGFQLAADAKKVNPDVKVSILRWCMPTWVATAWSSDKTGAGYEAVYKWYKETIFDAYEKYGYILDYVNPDRNETSDPDEAFIKWFKEQLVNEDEFPSYMDDAAQQAYHNIKIIASDENTSLNIVPSMRSDSDLYNAVDAIGFHYRAGDATSTADYRTMADVDDKEVWYSEGCATFSYTEYQENKTTTYGAGTIGGYQSPLGLADNFIKSFVYSRKTHYIFQPAIGSFYEGAQYDHKELLSAREPWAGYVHYDEMIYLLEHYTKFAKTGWENEDNTAGIWRVIANASANNSAGSDHLTNETGEPSYMTLASPDKKDFSVVIVNNSDKTLSYSISPKDMEIEDGAPMEIWESKTDSYLNYQGEAAYENGSYNLTVEPYSMVTVTTLDCDGKEEYTKRLPEETDKTVLDTDETGKNANTTDSILYADDFSYDTYDEEYLASRGNEPRYIVDLSGAFTVQNGALTQVLTSSVDQWNSNTPNCTVGDFRWMNYKASVDVTLTGTGYAGINIREQTGMNFEGSGYNLQIKKDGTWTLKKQSTTLASGIVEEKETGTYRLSLEGKGSIITAFIDGNEVACYKDSEPVYFGRVRLGCDWQTTSFDNLLVETVVGHMPYATNLLDNAQDEVTYSSDDWNIIAGAGGSSSDWYRSTSTSTAAGATVTFPVDGTGFALIGKNTGDAVLDVTVDGTLVASDEPTTTSPYRYSTYLYNKLAEGNHTVTITVKSGTLVLDAIDLLSDVATDKTELEAEVTKAEGLQQGEYLEDSWNTMMTALESAKEVIADTAVAQEEIDTSYYTLKSAINALLEGDTVIEVENVSIAAYAGKEAALPSTITYTLANGSTKEVEVTWDSVPSLTAYETITVNGVVEEDNRAITATIEVIPEHTVWFIDSGIDLSNQTSTVPFEAVKALEGTELLNQTADQAYVEGTTTWGYDSEEANIKSQSNLDMADKTASGIYALGNGTTACPITYTLPLEAGEYTIGAGFKEWWGMNRYMNFTAVWTDSEGEHNVSLGDTISLSSTNTTAMTTGMISVKEDATVQVIVTMASGTEAPVISWLCINKETEEQSTPTETPEETSIPEQTTPPEETSTPVQTTSPEGTSTPVQTASPENTSTPSPTVKPTTVKVSKVALNKSKATVAIGKTLQLKATITPSNATNKKVTWKSSNVKIATVNSAGLVTTKATGKVTITATAADGTKKKATCTITVVRPITKVVLDCPSSVTITKGNTKTLSAYVVPTNTTQSKKLTWTSSNKKVVTVSKAGVITGKSKGTATITIKASNGITNKVKVTVEAAKTVQYKKTIGIKYRISWAKQSAAKGYYIYYSTDGAAYKKLAVVSGNTKKTYDTTLKAGHTYRFKIKAFTYKNGKITLSSYKKASAKKLEKAVQAKFTNLAGYTGYQIQMRTKKKGTYTSWKTVKTEKATEEACITYSKTGIKSNVTYEFRIRGYKIKNGKKVYTTLKVK